MAGHGSPPWRFNADANSLIPTIAGDALPDRVAPADRPRWSAPVLRYVLITTRWKIAVTIVDLLCGAAVTGCFPTAGFASTRLAGGPP
jgi:hypothetical protein